MEDSAGVTATASSGIGFVNFGVSLNYQFRSSTSTSYGEYQEESVTEQIQERGGKGTTTLSKLIEMECDQPNGSSAQTAFPSK